MMHEERTLTRLVQSSRNFQEVLELRWASTSFMVNTTNSTRLKSILTWLLNARLRCMRVIVFLVSLL